MGTHTPSEEGGRGRQAGPEWGDSRLPSHRAIQLSAGFRIAATPVKLTHAWVSTSKLRQFRHPSLHAPRHARVRVTASTRGTLSAPQHAQAAPRLVRAPDRISRPRAARRRACGHSGGREGEGRAHALLELLQGEHEVAANTRAELAIVVRHRCVLRALHELVVHAPRHHQVAPPRRSRGPPTILVLSSPFRDPLPPSLVSDEFH